MSALARKKRKSARRADPKAGKPTRRRKPVPLRRIAHLTHHAFRDLVPGKIRRVIVPVGTVEAHGVLPLGTDTLIPDRLADRLAEPLDALIAPAMPYGITSSLLPYPGSMTLEVETFIQVMTQVGSELSRNGFQEAIFLNGHGGQTDELRRVVSRLWKEAGLFGMVVEWWPLAADVCREVYGTTGGHGGVDETAAVVALAPDLVEPGRMRPSLEYRMRPGIAARPAPAPILHFGEDDGGPSFDPVRAARYLEGMVEAVLEEVKRVLDGWRKNLPS